MRIPHPMAERPQDTRCSKGREFAPHCKQVTSIWNTVPSRRSCSQLGRQSSPVTCIQMDLNFRLWLHKHLVDPALYGCRIHRCIILDMVVIVHGLGVCFMPQKLIRMYYRYKTTVCIISHYIAGGFCVNLWLLCLLLFIDYAIYLLKQSKCSVFSVLLLFYRCVISCHA